MGGFLVPDLVVFVLLLLDWESLLQASRVCKSWRSIIRSAKFRSQWRNIHRPGIVLLTAYNSQWDQHPRPQQVLIWSPSSAGLPPTPLPPWMKIPLPTGTFDIVASSHGLILARHPSWSSEDSPGVEFTVGNPTTNEWVKIPRLANQEFASRAFSMAVDPATGHFQLLDGINQYIYHSTSGSWAQMNVPYVTSPCPRLLINNVYPGDNNNSPVVDIREPLLEDPESLGCLGCSPFAWEHEGKRYVAMSAVDLNAQCSVLYKVWSCGMQPGPSGAHDCDILSTFEIDLANVMADDTMAVECQAEGALVCFAGQCRSHYPLYGYRQVYGGDGPVPVVVADLEQRQWFYVPADESLNLHYRRAVVYRPSLVRPAGGGPPPKFGAHECLWHKRKREDQPDVTEVRHRRLKAVTQCFELYEDIFYL